MDAVLRASGHCPFLSLHDAPYGTVQWQMAAAAEREVSLKEGDGKSSETWGELWGDHVRRGFYDPTAYASSAAGPAGSGPVDGRGIGAC